MVHLQLAVWLSQPSTVALWLCPSLLGLTNSIILPTKLHVTEWEIGILAEAMWGRWWSVDIIYLSSMITCHGHLKGNPHSPHKLADVFMIGDFYQLWPPAGCVNLFGLPHNPGGGVVERGFG